MRDTMTSTGDTAAPTPGFFSPGELCERWGIDYRTLAKIDLPWVVLTARVRRVPAGAVFEFERRNPFYAEWANRQQSSS